MNISDNGLDLIKNFEGFRSEKYQDIGGLWTIGYGHLIEPDEDYDNEITEDQGTQLLEQDVSGAESVINEYVTVSLTQGQFDALVSLVYNWGASHFENSHGLELLNSGDYDGAIAGFQGVNKVNGVISQGLVNRRTAETNLWNGGTA